MNSKIHFHSIDAMRFFAFLKIFFTHIPIQGDFPVFSFLKRGGGIGVSFFFVLSGFLITYLLAHEKKENGQINLRHFFLRRSFRIWPLYFLWVIIVYTVSYPLLTKIGFHMTGGGYLPNWIYSFSFLENYKMLLEDNFPRTTPLPVFWSLCIEEHFYILWMIALYLIPYKRMVPFLMSCVVVSWVARFAEPSIFNNSQIVQNDVFTNLDLFAIGGILGYYICDNYVKVSTQINSIKTSVKYGVLSLVLLMVIFQQYISDVFGALHMGIFLTTFQAIFFTATIAILIPQNSRIKINDSNPLSYLGRISYGLYVYHIIVIHVAFQYCLNNNIVLDSTPLLVGFVAVTFMASVAISSLSFQYFEKPFLTLRNKIK